MDTAIISSPTFNDYWNVVKDWSNEMKLALISKLSTSMMRPAKKTKVKTLADFYGVMKDDPYFPTVEELRDIMRDEPEDIEKFVI